MSSIILVTGANRGIGGGLVTHYLAQPDTTVIGTVCDVSSENAKDLAVSEIQTQHYIEHIDIVIANAGICNHYGRVLEMADSDVLSHFEVNTLGLLRLLRAVAPLLQKVSTPKFAYISTLLASIHEIEQIPSLTAAYGMPKVAGNYLIKKIDAENEGLTALASDPGMMVQTDVGSRAAQAHELEKAPVTVQDTIEAATKATTSGQFVNYNGEKVRW
ncbi:hypothetical protein BDW75DRAFT_249471 [Aspergillus navahoensis]